MLRRLLLTLLALACVSALAAAPMDDWCGAYNALAGEHGLPLVDPSEFIVDGMGKDAYHIFYFDDDTALMLALEEDGVPFICAVEGRLGDVRLGGILAAAMSASRGQEYYECLRLTEKALFRLESTQAEIEGEEDGWYFAGGIEEDEGVKYVILGFSYVGMELPDLEKDAPGESEPVPGPTPEPEPRKQPAPTPKHETPGHKA